MFNKLFNILNLKKKRLMYSLLIICGISFSKIKKLLTFLGLNILIDNVKYLSILKKEKNILKNLEKFVIEKENKYFFINENLKKKFKKYIKINHYKGKRLIHNLPLNGQRTHTNAKTFKRLKKQW